jgi:dTDP-4-dehydrorhamnose reductase
MTNTPPTSGSVGNVAVLGARSMVAQELLRVFAEDPAFGWVASGARPDVDLTTPRTVHYFLEESEPAVVVNCAAMTDVDACEGRVAEAFAVNAEGAGRAAVMAARRKALFVHISTDYVFDGLKGAPYIEEDETSPLSVYGRSKLEGERLVEAAGGDWLIVRTAWLFGPARRNFVDRMLAAARERGEVSGATDHCGSPTSARDLALAVAALIKARAGGLYHVVNAGGCSRYEAAQAAVAGAGLTARVLPARCADFPRPARVPANSVLSAEKLRRDIGHTLRPWREAVTEYAAARAGA